LVQGKWAARQAGCVGLEQLVRASVGNPGFAGWVDVDKGD
jgi:hypothetical protein